MHKFLLIFLSTVSFMANARVVYRPSAATFEENQFSLGAKLKYWSTSGYYNYDGTDLSLNGLSYNSTDMDIYMTYGYSNKFQIDAMVKVRRNVSDSIGESTSVIGLESVHGGFKYKLYDKNRWKQSIGLWIWQTLYTNPQTPQVNTIILGDQGQSVAFSYHVSYASSPFNFWSGHIGVRGISNLSDELTYHIEKNFSFNKKAIYLGIRGVQSFENDSYTVNPQGKPNLDFSSTYLWNSVNRSWMKPYAGFILGVTKYLKFSFEYETIIAGVSTDQGRAFSFNFTYETPAKTSNQKFDEQFKTYDLEATLIKVSPRQRFVKIDKGGSDDIKKAMRFDIYAQDEQGKNILVAAGLVYETSSDKSIIKIMKIYRKIPLTEGMIARTQIDQQ